jgi:RimJ/RimL family protein N-acetyltransferase
MEYSTHKLNNDHILKIREAVVDDAPQLLEFVHRVSAESGFLTFGPGEFDINEQEEREFIQTRRDSENQLFLLAILDNEIVALLIFNAGQRPRIQHSGEFSMVVSKQYWRLGIGSSLLDTLFEWARSSQIIKKINLRVRKDNEDAIGLYEQNGFVIEGTIRKEIFLNGKYYDLLCMGLEL